MSLAFKCDRCGEITEGSPSVKVKTNKMVVAINYSPEITQEISWYQHDLCEKCADALVKWWKNLTGSQQIT